MSVLSHIECGEKAKRCRRFAVSSSKQLSISSRKRSKDKRHLMVRIEMQILALVLKHKPIRVNSCTPPYTTQPIGGRKGAPRKKHDPSMNPILRMSRPSLTMCGFNSASTDSTASVSSSAVSSCSSIRAKSTGTSLNYYDQTGPSRSKRRWPNPARKRASQQEASDGEDPPRVICLPKGTCQRGDP